MNDEVGSNFFLIVQFFSNFLLKTLTVFYLFQFHECHVLLKLV